MQKKIMLVAGEASGDKHGAALIKQLQNHQAVQCYGMGMQKMKQAGMRLLVDAQPLAVIGIVEILVHYPALRRAFKTLKQALVDDPPDLLVLIDYPEFNLKLARVAAQHKIKVLYYISPQLWAWRQYRIKKIKRSVDLMAVIFPFERDFYARHHVPVRYVGHPLIEEFKQWTNHPPQTSESSERAMTLLLLPGSRKGEIKRLLPLMLKAAVLIKKRLNKPLRCRLLVAPDIDEKLYIKYLINFNLACSLSCDHSYSEMENADLAISATGTATLELALCGVPHIATHKLSWLSYWILKWFIKIPYASLPNIIADRAVVPECLQGKATPQHLANHACRLLNDSDARADMKQALLALRERFGTQLASKTTAEVVAQLIKD